MQGIAKKEFHSYHLILLFFSPFLGTLAFNFFLIFFLFSTSIFSGSSSSNPISYSNSSASSSCLFSSLTFYRSSFLVSCFFQTLLRQLLQRFLMDLLFLRDINNIIIFIREWYTRQGRMRDRDQFMSSKEILILGFQGWKDPGRTGLFSSFQKIISQIFFFTCSRDKNSYIICFFSQSENSQPFSPPTFFPFLFPRTSSTVVQKSYSRAVFQIYLVVVFPRGRSLVLRMFLLAFIVRDYSRMALLVVSLTDTELASLLPAIELVFPCDLSTCFLSLYKGRVCVLFCVIAGSGCCWTCVVDCYCCAMSWYFFLQALLICPSRKRSSFSSSFPQATRRANFRLQSSHLLLKNMLVWMSSNRSFSNSFFLSIILFLICSSLVLALSQLSSFWAAISSFLYCSISSAYFLWKCECSFTLRSQISESRLDFVCWIVQILLFPVAVLGCEVSSLGYGGDSEGEDYFCM